MLHRFVILTSCIALAVPGTSFGQSKTVLAREAAEYVMRKFGKQAAEIGVETLSGKLESLAIKHGNDVFLAARKVGPRTLRIVEEAGEHGLDSVKLLARFGNDAVWVVTKKNRMAIFIKYGDNAAESMMKHGEIVEPLLASFGKPAAAALNSVSSQNARRLAMMAQDSQLTKMGRTSELLDVVGKYGDRAGDFIWRNKGALTVTAALSVFLANPEPFLEGATDITKIVAENAIKPVANIPAQIASEAAKNTNWTFVLVCGLFALGLTVGARLWLRHRSTVANLTSSVKAG